jgi:hypothetical protein
MPVTARQPCIAYIYQALDFCKKNGIVLLSFPPHCTHKLQPLDRAVFGPFKKMINTNDKQIDPDTPVDDLPTSSVQTDQRTDSNDLSNKSYNQRPNSPVPGPSGLQQANSSQPFNFTPKDLRPLPQAGPRTITNKGRKKRKTAILTDTPEKNAIEEEYQQRNKAKKRILQPDTGKGKKKLISTKRKGKGKKDNEGS